MYKYIYKKGKENHPVFILLHGTGGNEQNLLPAAEVVDEDATIISILGNVVENGMNRYFERHGEGHYNWEDLDRRGQELYTFIEKLSKEHGFALADAIYLGFSNGSNIAMNMLLREETKINKGMLFAPMYPTEVSNEIDLSDRKVFLSMGENDPIVPVSESQRVIKTFTDLGAEVTEYWVNSHDLTRATLLAGKEWYEDLTK